MFSSWMDYKTEQIHENLMQVLGGEKKSFHYMIKAKIL